MRRFAFTLVEILMVLAILSVLAALTFPVLRKVQGSAGEASCRSNLRQWWAALQLYRLDYDAVDSPSTTWQMGLPNFGAYDHILSSAYGLTCKGLQYPLGDKVANIGYGARWPMAPFGFSGSEMEEAQRDWMDYVEAVNDPVVFFDPNHQHFYPATRLSRQRALFVTLGGTVGSRIKQGDMVPLEWWK